MEGKVMIQKEGEEMYLDAEGKWTSRVSRARDFETVEAAKEECARQKFGPVRITLYFFSGKSRFRSIPEKAEAPDRRGRAKLKLQRAPENKEAVPHHTTAPHLRAREIWANFGSS